jgi:hypothetical protein
MVASPKGLGSENDRAGKSQQHIQKRAPHKNKIVTVEQY